MAKKGGISQINGFVSIRNEDPKTTSKKVVSTTVSESQKKASTSSKKPSRTSTVDAHKLKQSETSVIKRKSETVDLNKTKTVSESSLQNTNNQKVNISTSKPRNPVSKTRAVAPETSKSSVRVTTSVSSSKVAPTSRKPEIKSTVASAPKKDVTSKRDSTASVSKKDVTTNRYSVPKKDVKIKRGSTDSVPKKDVTTKRGSTDSVPKKDVTTKRDSTDSVPEKDVTTKRDSTDRKTLQTKVSVNPTSIKSSRTESVKKMVELNPKKVINARETRGDAKKKVVSQTSDGSSKPSVNVNRTSTSKKKSDVTTIKISSREKSYVKVKESGSTSSKGTTIADKINIKSSHQDSLYFEIDMGTKKKDPPKRPSKVADIVPSQPPPMSRQGTFTKDDEGSKETSLTLPVVSSEKNQSPQAEEEDEYEYEDDFEDYESDFEEYISESGVSSDSESELSKGGELIKSTIRESSAKTRSSPPERRVEGEKKPEKTIEEERKLDSGNYDLTTKSANYTLPQSVKQKQLDQIKEAISRENSLYSAREKEVPKPVIVKEVKDVLDFVGALKRQDAESAKIIKKNRSSIILEKIKLHTQQISIFEAEFFFIDTLDPIYKNRNVEHASTQAEIVMLNEEVQTDEIKTRDKWIQFPTAFHKLRDSDNNLEVYFEDHRGFGGDNVEIDLNSWMNPYYNPEKLYSFIESAGQVILIMLEEEERWKSDGSISVMKGKHDHGFSRGYIPIQTKNVEFLNNRPICDIVFSPHNQNIFLSSHRFVKDIENLPSFEDQFLGRSVICLWNILEPSQPLSMFVASCQISAISFDIVHTNLLYGGLTEGSVCLWDTNERSIFHKETIAGGVDYLLRTPSYCSSYLLSNDLHNNVIVAIQSLGYEYTEKKSSGKFTPTEILTMDSDGKIIVWVAVLVASDFDSNFVIEKDEDFGQTPWSKYKLVANRTLNPLNNLPASQHTWSLQFLCMNLAPRSNRGVLLGTNTGTVVNCILSDEKANIPVYSNKEETDCIISILSIERSPHNLPVFLAGCSNGTVRIHLIERKRPIRILVMESQLRGSPVTKIRWSLLGAGLFFILDKNLCLHLWDLCKGESSPLISLSLKKLKATHFDISTDNKFVYMALVVHKERLEIHRLKEQFTPDGAKNNERDKDIFLSFIDKCCY